MFFLDLLIMIRNVSTKRPFKNGDVFLSRTKLRSVTQHRDARQSHPGRRLFVVDGAYVTERTTDNINLAARSHCTFAYSRVGVSVMVSERNVARLWAPRVSPRR